MAKGKACLPVGKVYLIGAGPGKPDLISVRGLNILKQAEVVIYDYLVDKKLLEGVPAEAELIGADRLGKSRSADGFSKAQEKINHLLVEKAKAGKKVVRLKNGDPSIFGRLSQELEVLVKHKIEYEIVPGITAASAAAAYAGIPLTDRRFSSSVIFVTGHEDPSKGKRLIDWEKVAALPTIVLYMAVENLPQIAAELVAAGKSKGTPVLAVSEVGSFRQRSTRGSLGEIVGKVKAAKISAPAIIVIGQVAVLEKNFDWFEKNRRVLFTGLSEERYFMEGTFFHLPLIKIEPLADYEKFDRHLEGIEKYDWIVFSSRFGVEHFFRRLASLGFDARQLSGRKIAAIGTSTRQRLRDFCIKADLVAGKESSQGLLAEFKRLKIGGEKIFLPRSDIADKGLGEGLKKLGADVISAAAYRNKMPSDLPDLDLNFFDEIYFTSPSTVRNFKTRYGKIPEGVKIRWIGDVTRRELIKRGFLSAKA